MTKEEIKNQEIEETQEVKVQEESNKDKFNFKIFDMWDISEIKITDPGLRKVINLEPMLVLKTHGRNVEKHGQTKINIVERLMNRLALTGHRNKKHRIEVGHSWKIF